jgi:hypothetical protein
MLNSLVDEGYGSSDESGGDDALRHHMSHVDPVSPVGPLSVLAAACDNQSDPISVESASERGGPAIAHLARNRFLVRKIDAGNEKRIQI